MEKPIILYNEKKDDSGDSGADVKEGKTGVYPYQKVGEKSQF